MHVQFYLPWRTVLVQVSKAANSHLKYVSGTALYSNLEEDINMV